MVTCADKPYFKKMSDEVLSESYRQGVIFSLDYFTTLLSFPRFLL